MAEIGIVRQNSYENYSEGQTRYSRLNRRGELVVVDFFSQCILDGRTFHMQLGTEDAPIDSTAAVDDTLAWVLMDNSAGWATIPTLYKVSVAGWTTATIGNVMLEVDRAKARYSSGGTAYVPENLRTDRPRVAVGTFYVGTDITASAKTAVPGSIELWRHVLNEDVTTTATGGENVNVVQFNARVDPFAVVVDVGSILGYFGATTADLTGYGAFQFIQLPKESVV